MSQAIDPQHADPHATSEIMVEVNRAVAIFLGVIAVAAIVLYLISRDGDRHAGSYALIIGSYLLPFSAAFAIAAVGWRRRWTVRLPLQLLPVAVFYLWKFAL